MKTKLTEEEKKEQKKMYQKAYLEKNKEKVAIAKKKYREKNREIINQKGKEYYEKNKEHYKKYREENKEKIIECQKKYYQENKERIKQKTKIYQKANRETINEKVREYKKKRKEVDPVYKLKLSIGKAIRKALKRNNYTKECSTYKILGCTYEEFKLHLESKFEPWMNWSNYGLYNGEPNYGWDIDHIEPQSKAITEEELIKLNNYTNMQPLCSHYNRDIKKDYLL
jgi:hypothetical protein